MYWSLYYRTIILTDQLRFPLIVRITTRSWAVLSAATVSVVIQQTWSNERYCFKHSSVPVFWAVLSEVLRASSCELCIYVCSIIYETHNGYLYESYCYINSIDEEWSGYTGAGFEWYILTRTADRQRTYNLQRHLNNLFSGFRKLCNLRLEYVAATSSTGSHSASIISYRLVELPRGVRWKEACSHATSLYMKLIVNYL